MNEDSLQQEQARKRSFVLFAAGLVGVACIMSVVLLWLNLNTLQRDMVLEYFGWGDNPVRLDIEGTVRDERGQPVEGALVQLEWRVLHGEAIMANGELTTISSAEGRFGQLYFYSNDSLVEVKDELRAMVIAGASDPDGEHDPAPDQVLECAARDEVHLELTMERREP